MKRKFLGLVAFGILSPFGLPIALAADSFTITPALNSQAVFSCGDFTASGNSNVIDSIGSGGSGVSGNQAHVVSNGNIVLNGSTAIYGNAIAGPGMGVTTNGGAAVLGTESANTALVDCRPIDLAALSDSLRLSNDNAKIPLTAQGRSALTGGSLTDFSLRSGDSITLPTGRYFFTSVDIGSGSIVNLAGPVDIFSTGNVSVNGGSQINASGSAYALSFWCSGQTFSLQSDKSVLSAFVYAPSANVGVTGGARLIGGVFGGTVTVNGGSRITRSVDQSVPLTISFSEGGADFPSGKIFNRSVVPVVTLSGGNVPRLTSLTLNGAPFVSGAAVSAEGNYSLAAVADDSVGRHVVAAVSFSIDETPPSFAALSPPDGSLLRVRQQVLTGTTDAVSASVNGAAATISGGTLAAQVSLAEGSNVVAISGVDAAGNVGGTTIRWTVDTLAPSISIQSPPDGFLTGSSTINVSGAVSDASAVSVSVNGVPASASAGVFAASSVPLVEGSNPIVAVAADAAGNSSSSAITAVRDTTPPAVDVLDGSVSISDGALFNHQPVPTISASDAHLDTVSSTLNGAAFVSGTIVASDGSYDLVVTAADKVGNSTRREIHFTVDTTPPALSISSPANGALLVAQTTSVAGACGDAVTVVVNGSSAAISGGQFHVEALSLPEGTSSIVVIATDSAGNSTTKAVTVSVDTTPPSVSLASPADHAYVGSVPFGVTGVASDAHLQSTTVNGVSVVVGQDGVFQTTLAAPEGPFTITAVATDAGGRSATASVTVTVDTKPPTIAITNAGVPLSDGFLTNKPVTPVIQVADASPVTIDARLNGAPFLSGSPVSADGAYRLDVTAKDAAGNIASQTVIFSVDSQPPRIAGLLPAEGSILKPGPVTVSGSCEDAVSVKVNGVPASVSSGAFNLPGVQVAGGSNVFTIVATDSAGNSGTATLTLTGDGDPPVVTITSPAANLLTRTSTLTVNGTATDAHLGSVTVNGAPATLSGSSFTRPGVSLTEGDNLIDVVATDVAGNTGEARETVTLDTVAPILAITSPVAGAVLGTSKIEVSGNVSDSHLDTVSVNGIPAAVSSGHFVASGVSLSAGANTITASASDKAGNGSTASVTISYDDRAPVVSIAAPKDGARLRSQPVTVTGAVEGGTGLTLTVNGQAATITGKDFSASGIPLSEGDNVLTARATNDSGKEGVATISVSFDDVAPTVTSVSPSDGAYDLPLSTVVRVVFSEPIDPATATSQNLTVVRDSLGPVSGKLTLDGVTAMFVPDSGFAEKSAFTISVSTGVTDLAGNPIAAPAQSHFRTGSASAPDSPVLDTVRHALCAATIPISGSTEPYFRIAISGGAALATGTADAAGKFSIPVSLSANSQNVLAVVATDTQGSILFARQRDGDGGLRGADGG